MIRFCSSVQTFCSFSFFTCSSCKSKVSCSFSCMGGWNTQIALVVRHAGIRGLYMIWYRHCRVGNGPCRKQKTFAHHYWLLELSIHSHSQQHHLARTCKAESIASQTLHACTVSTITTWPSQEFVISTAYQFSWRVTIRDVRIIVSWLAPKMLHKHMHQSPEL